MKQKKISLDLCADEPIHIPNLVQNFGFLLVLDTVDLVILQCSENVNEFLGCSPAILLNTSLSKFLPANELSIIRHHLQNLNFESNSTLRVNFQINEVVFHFQTYYHLSGDSFVMEFEPYLESEKVIYTLENNFIDTLKKCNTLEKCCGFMADYIKQITNYDRVMVYQFDKNWHGEVVSEAKETHLHSFLYHHFPASDIPAQARELYTKNLTRIICDVNYEPSPITPKRDTKTNQPLDLSLSNLRSPSPIHIEYLQNMGVRATLVISIIFEGKLWGLITCHHYQYKFVGYPLRKHIELLGKFFSAHLQSKEEYADLEQIISFQEKVYDLMSQGYKMSNFFSLLDSKYAQHLQLDTTKGLAICYDNDVILIGTTPPSILIEDLTKWLNTQDFSNQNYFYTDRLVDFYPKAQAYTAIASGIFVIKTSLHQPNYLIWFKPETEQIITWAGNPDKAIIYQENSHRLSPRKSFEQWKETLKNTSLPWTNTEIKCLLHFRERFVEFLASKSERMNVINRLLKQKISQSTKDLRNTLLKLQAIHDSTTNVNIFVDKDYKIVAFNKKALENSVIFHGKQIEEGDLLLDYMATDEMKSNFIKLFERASTGEVIMMESLVEYTQDLKLWLRSEYHSVIDHKNNIIGVSLNIIDITERKNAELKVQEQNERLEEIAFIQSHKVRRPLANILGLMTLINRTPKDVPDFQNFLDLLDTSANELDDVIREIVNMTE